ncbi:hypothetical protein BX265_8344 [Streptomyces sp. TLI_235]|nr:hypothetical protein [Streptomyces sp. TLI_235]PBC66281.1 hypothetical protein BX265_8344 [Streptomyces sp. TLI_235]
MQEVSRVPTTSFAYAWCFDHGRLHRFPAGDEPWCSAAWVPLAGATEEEAVEAKWAAYGDARFLHDLSEDKQRNFVEIR